MRCRRRQRRVRRRERLCLCLGRWNYEGNEMDHGAHYVKTDLQVHTPRDPNWKLRCVTDSDREQFGRDFIAACRVAGLGAVAITDHHDFTFVPFIRNAARTEIGADGGIVPPERQVVVFPGLELTLAVPCQALLVFSADFPDQRLPAILGKLAIDPAEPSDEKATAPVEQLPFESFQDLHDRLDEDEWLKGQYIVFPNVTDGGHQTLMRAHMQAKYRDMPCVGGYLDKPDVGKGNRQIFAGLNPQWGNKKIATVLTSDARTLDAVGAKASWIKWAEPTAEALRQACLAEESRIAHAAPGLPAACVTRLHVSSSRFLGLVDLPLNRQYNALIGGRGTGKSTCLEYLRWALCDEPPRADVDEEGANLQLRRQRLIEQTLAPVQGHVEVQFEVNGVAHIVRRRAATGELLLKVGEAEMAPATEQQVRELLPLEAYSQRQLSSVGIQQDELTRFVNAPIRNQLVEFETRDGELSRAIRENFVQVQRQRALEQAVARDKLAVESLGQQISAVRDGVTGLSEHDREVIAEKRGWDHSDMLVKALSRRVEDTRSALSDAAALVRQLVPASEPSEADGLVGQPVVTEVQRATHDLLEAARSAVHGAEVSVDEGSRPGSLLADRLEAWRTGYEEFGRRYAEAAQRSTSHAATLAELTGLESRQRELLEALEAATQRASLLGDPRARHDELRERWRGLQRDRTALLERQCQELTKLSGGMIRASVVRGAGTAGQQDRFKAVIQGSKVRGSKVERLLAGVAEADDSLAAWHAVLDELEARVLAHGDPAAPLPQRTEALEIFGASEIERMREKLTPEAILELSLSAPDDQPSFQYRAKEGEYIAFKDSSAGQQATALLRVLLSQTGPPLVIDQPEDDLDSQVIEDVVRRVWAAKRARQLIFSSHNANLVVNGDAELVACCDYRAAGDHSAGTIKLEGAIDVPKVREEITKVMEGGERAFRLRKEKYGF